MPARARAAVPAAVFAAALFCTLILSAAVLSVAASLVGCSQPAPIPAGAGDVLVPGTTVTIDLDGDGVGERVLLEKSTRRLTISYGSVVYHSRDKWQVFEACLGDTDRSGLPEVVALLDAGDGRHLGLFAYVGGEYRERLVTSVLRPRPLSLRVVAANAPGAGDLVVLTEETAGSEAVARTTTYQWNGFGFTAVDTGASH